MTLDFQLAPVIALAILGVTLLWPRRAARRDRREQAALAAAARALAAAEEVAEQQSFFGSLRAFAKAAPPQAEPMFAAVCEIDRFEAIRRNLGYATANAILARLAGAVREALPGAGIGRLHRTSIEFAFRAADADAAEALLQQTITSFDVATPVDGCTLDLSLRVGFAQSDGALNEDELIERVEIALRDPAQRDRRIVFASAEPCEQAALRIGLLRDLQQAIEEDTLELHYQPKLRCRTGTIDSVEALLRWTHPRLGPVRPDDFVPMAEETGLIRRLTDWTLLRAVADQHRMFAAGHRVSIYVNISGVLLTDREFAASTLELLATAPGEIGLEITETAVIEDPARALANLQSFTKAGIKVAIDDYGSGLSSLAYLKQLPAHELKIDRLFISGLTSSHRDPLLVRSSIDLAHALDMEVTAEGVDNAMAMSLLSVMGCDLVQGFLVSPPLAVEPLIEFLACEDHLARITPETGFPRFGRTG